MPNFSTAAEKLPVRDSASTAPILGKGTLMLFSRESG